MSAEAPRSYTSVQFAARQYCLLRTDCTPGSAPLPVARGRVCLGGASHRSDTPRWRGGVPDFPSTQPGGKTAKAHHSSARRPAQPPTNSGALVAAAVTADGAGQGRTGQGRTEQDRGGTTAGSVCPRHDQSASEAHQLKARVVPASWRGGESLDSGGWECLNSLLPISAITVVLGTGFSL